MYVSSIKGGNKDYNYYYYYYYYYYYHYPVVLTRLVCTRFYTKAKQRIMSL